MIKPSSAFAAQASAHGLVAVRSRSGASMPRPGVRFDPDEVIADGFDPRRFLGGGDEGVKPPALADAALESLQTKRAIAL